MVNLHDLTFGNNLVILRSSYTHWIETELNLVSCGMCMHSYTLRQHFVVGHILIQMNHLKIELEHHWKVYIYTISSNLRCVSFRWALRFALLHITTWMRHVAAIIENNQQNQIHRKSFTTFKTVINFHQSNALNAIER